MCPPTRNGLLFLVSGARETTQGLVVPRTGAKVQRLDLRERPALRLGTRSGVPGLGSPATDCPSSTRSTGRARIATITAAIEANSRATALLVLAGAPSGRSAPAGERVQVLGQPVRAFTSVRSTVGSGTFPRVPRCRRCRDGRVVDRRAHP